MGAALVKLVGLLAKALGAAKGFAASTAAYQALLVAPVPVKVAILAGLAIATASVATTAVVYQVTKEPITQLPGVQQLPIVQAVTRKTPPRYLFSIYGIAKPLGIAVTPEGDRIYVTESGGERLTRVYDGGGKLMGTLAPPGTTAPERAPVYAALDKSGKVYVSDRTRHIIDTYSPAGQYLGAFLPNGDPHFWWSPLALAFGGAGDLYVTELTPGSHRVMVFDTQGNLKLQFGRQGDGPGEFAFPNGVAADEQGRIYVADSNNYRVQIFNKEGELLARVGGFALPRGLGIDQQARSVVVDTFGHQVQAFDTGGDRGTLFTFGGVGVADGKFVFPNGLALDARGRLYITDRENSRVQVWAY